MPDEIRVEVPLPQFVKEVATVAAWTVIKEHIKTCEGAKMSPRVRSVERRLSWIFGFMAGTGFLGGIAGAIITKLLGV
jgi:hypothetical protein